MFKTLILTIMVQTSTSGDLLNYYNSTSNPSYEEARIIVDENLKSPEGPYIEALARYLSGFLHRKQGDVVKATIDYNECLYLLQNEVDTLDSFLEVSVRKNLGAIWDDFKFYDIAIQYYEDAIPYAEKYSKKELASLYSNLGNSHRDKRDGENVIIAYMKSLDISHEIEDHYKVAQIYNKLGLSFFHADLTDTAEYFFYQAIYQRPHLTGKQLKPIGQAYHNLGQLLFNKGLTMDAIKSYVTALDYKHGDDKFITLMDLGEVMIAQNEYDKARTYLTEAMALYNAESSKKETHGVLKHLASLEDKTGNQAGALGYMNMYAAAMENHATEVDVLRDIKERQFFKQLIDTYSLDRHQNNLRDNLTWALICLIIALMVIIIPFFIILSDRKKVKRNLNDIERDLSALLD